MSAPRDHNLRVAFGALARGSLSALEDVWREWSDPLHNYAYALTRSQDEADDILSEVMVRIAERRWRLRLVRNPRAYLFAAVRNAALSRARRPREAPIDEVAEAAAAHDREEDVAVRSAVLGLADDQREVVVLHLWGGLTFAGIGRVMGIPQNTAASRYRYALAKLRAALGDDEDEAVRVRAETEANEA